ncbi:hypothetical protein B0T24DRAFT_712474 [Lasiosphaeria ovina]|uniref:Uncharacterized protein n=1 Tax=Lasiosphaeria ovina TaxID=92902 RepID=A0AAE0MZ77_9PEZI|nr:hypothetical protein B0T24DRAFT_712474 [Lasiosphaeria ovina]
MSPTPSISAGEDTKIKQESPELEPFGLDASQTQDTGRSSPTPFNEGIVVQWHGLKRSVSKPLLDILPSQDSRETLLHERPTGVAIRTGQTFLRADEEMPSYDLLQMHAVGSPPYRSYLWRAADATDDYYDSSKARMSMGRVRSESCHHPCI